MPIADDVRVVLELVDGYTVHISVSSYLRAGDLIRSMALTVNNLPVVRVPFNAHDGMGSLHTMCRRAESEDPDQIDQVEY